MLFYTNCIHTSNNKPILSSPEDKNDQTSQLDELKAQVKDLQFEVDLLRETLNVIKKDQGANLKTLKNREKTVIVGALKDVYPLSFICKKLSLSRSCYYYHSSLTKTKDKYQDARKRIADIFHSNYDAYGYRRIYSALKQQKICISEKVIRRIMKRDGLVVTVKRRRKYNSYKGEITPAVPNLINRDFHADKPNQLWLTDITEFSIKAGKVYLSALIDCFDGMPVKWTMGTSPNAKLVNTMLEQGVKTLGMDERPIVHSDRGCHYRWDEWIELMNKSNFTRSMSKKGCSADNAACEGFFGHLKTEMFYGRSWDNYTISEFIEEVNKYIEWYRMKRIKLSLGGISLIENRRRLGVAV